MFIKIGTSIAAAKNVTKLQTFNGKLHTSFHFLEYAEYDERILNLPIPNVIKQNKSKQLNKAIICETIFILLLYFYFYQIYLLYLSYHHLLQFRHLLNNLIIQQVLILIYVIFEHIVHLTLFWYLYL